METVCASASGPSSCEVWIKEGRLYLLLVGWQQLQVFTRAWSGAFVALGEFALKLPLVWPVLSACGWICVFVCAFLVSCSCSIQLHLLSRLFARISTCTSVQLGM